MNKLTLLLTILTIGIATLFTACGVSEDLEKATCETKGWCVSTIAGSPISRTLGYYKDDPIGRLAQFHEPRGITLAKDDSALYVADSDNDRIRKIDLTSPYEVTTIAGDGKQDYKDSPTGMSAQFGGPMRITIAPDGNALYVADTRNHRIRKIALVAPYKVTTIAGDGKQDYKDSPTGMSAQFNHPIGMALAKDGNTLYVADTFNHRIRKIDLTSPYEVTTIAGNPTLDISGNPIGGDAVGEGADAQFSKPEAIAIAPDGNTLYVADSDNHQIKKIDLTSPYNVTTIAGDDTPELDEDDDDPIGGNKDGIGTLAQFSHPRGIAIAKDGNTLYVADIGNDRIRKIALPSGKVSTIAGSTQGNKDGTGTSAQFYSPHGIVAAKDKDGNTLYVADTDNHRIRKLEYKE